MNSKKIDGMDVGVIKSFKFFLISLNNENIACNNA